MKWRISWLDPSSIYHLSFINSDLSPCEKIGLNRGLHRLGPGRRGLLPLLLMKLTDFSFKREPLWILVFSLGPAALGLLVVLIVWLMR
ncbi:MAG TPA: hypothetical protein VNO50_19305 [Pyrinomonadaceae bacterium]|nr:hypothetical protein [Pyrinomonadaceae bacterium]